MSLIPSPYTLQVRSLTDVTDDGLGNVEAVWSEPRPWQVRQIDPGQSAEPYLPNRDLSSVEYAVHADKTGEVPGEDDQVQVDGDWHDVDGKPADWTLGPWVNPVAGVVVLLKRVEG